MELCVFQGTFNPIHNAHLRVAEYVLNKYNLDKIIFIPAFCPPHKNFDISYSTHRLNLVRLSTDYNPKFIVSDIEYRRGGKSYTYLTIKELIEEFNIKNKIYFIIGTDAFKNIKTWYKTDLLKNYVKFLVFERENNFNPKDYDILKSSGYDFEFQTLDFEDISSTEIREFIRTGKSIDNMVTKKAKEYIEKYELYKN